MEVFLTDEQVEKIVELYVAYFNRAPEYQGLQFHLNIVVQQMQAAVDGGATVDQAFQAAYLDRADQFFDDAIATGEAGFSLGTTQQDFIEIVYRNVLQRYDDNNDGIGDVDPDLPPPSDAEIAFWVAQLNAGLTRGEMITSFIDSIDILLAQGTPEEMVIAQAQRDSLDNRVAVAEYFSQQSVSGQLTGANAQEAGRIALQGVTNDDATIQPAIDNITDLLTPDLDPSAASVDEGGTISFVLDTNFIDPGTQYVYTITGVSAADVVGGSLTGVVTLDSQGRAVINVTLAQDGVSEGPETITVSVAGVSTSAIVNDTSLTNFVLTAGADVAPQSTGTNFADTYTGNNTTLTQGDNLDGNDGFDTFNYSTTGGFSVNESGFVINDIERININVDNGGNGTVFDMSGVDTDGTNALQVVNNLNSSNDLTLNGVRHLVDLEITNTSTPIPGNFVNTTVNYTAAAVAGANDTQNVLLTNVFDPSIGPDAIPSSDDDLNTGSPVSNLPNFNTNLEINGAGTGVETVAITTAGDGISSLNVFDVDGLHNVTVAGTQGLVIDGVNYALGVNTFDASALTGGGVAIRFDNAAVLNNNLSVLGSNQADVFDFQNGISVEDSVDGNDGIDNVVLSGNVAGTSGFEEGGTATGASYTEVEALRINSGGISAVDVGRFDGALADIWVNTSMSGPTTFANLNDATRIHIDQNQAGLFGQQLILDHRTGGSSVSVIVNNVDGGANFSIDDEEFDTAPGSDGNVATLTLEQNGSTTSFVDLTGLDVMTTLNLAGSADQFLTGAGDGTPVLTVIDGSTATGDLDLDGLASMLAQANGNQITGGFGDDDATGTNFADTFNMGDGDDEVTALAGADVINGGAGNDDLDGGTGNDIIDGGADSDFIDGGSGADQLTGGTGPDTFYYDQTSDSQGILLDTITDFTSGEDEIDLLDALSAANGVIVNPGDFVFVGNANGLAAAETALSGLGTVEAVFDTASQQLYVDVDGNGDIDGAIDMIINLPNVTALASGDLTGSLGDLEVFTANTAAFQTSDPNDSLEGIATSAANTSIRATAAQLFNSTINGGGGTGIDALNVTTQMGAFDFNASTTTSDIEFLNLRAGSNGNVVGPNINNLIVNLNQAAIFTTGSAVNGQEVNGSAAADTITATNTNDDVDGAGGVDEVVIAAANFDGSAQGGGQAGDNLTLNDEVDIADATVGGFSTLTLVDDATVSMAQKQTLGLNVVAPGANNTVTVVGGGTTATDLDVESYVFDSNNQVVSFNGLNQSFNMGDGDDELRYLNGSGSFTGTLNGGLGSDTLDIWQPLNSDITGATVTGFEFIQADNLTLTAAQHVGFVDFTEDFVDTNFFTVTTAFAGANANEDLFVLVENYTLNGGNDDVNLVGTNSANRSVNLVNGTNNIDVSVAGGGTVSITGGTGSDTVSIAAGAVLTSGSTVNTDGASDTINVNGVSGNLATLTGVAINSGTGADTFNLSFSTGGTFDGDDQDDVFNVTSSTGWTINAGDDDDDINLDGISSGTINAGDDNDDIRVGDDAASATFSGVINGGTGTDTLHLGDFFNGGVIDISGVTSITGIDIVHLDNTNATYRMTAGIYEQLRTTGAGFDGNGGSVDTIQISNSGTITAFVTNNEQIENYVLQGTGNDSFTINLPDTAGGATNDNTIYSVDISAGGSDVIRINNGGAGGANVDQGDNDSFLTVTGFNVADDQLRLAIEGGVNGTFQTINAANTALTIGANGTVEISSTVAAIIAFQDVSDAGAVETIIANAIGDDALVNAGNFNVVMYGSGNAYVYSVDITAATADVATNQIDVELVGVLNGVAADALTSANFTV